MQDAGSKQNYNIQGNNRTSKEVWYGMHATKYGKGSQFDARRCNGYDLPANSLCEITLICTTELNSPIQIYNAMAC